MSGGIYSRPVVFALVAAAVILVGTLVTTFIPMASEQMHPKLENLRPFSPLELAGRDVYQREGCVNCHTQTVRPLKAEVMRYGEYSKAGEFAYDRPFLWGSKRTGPDLARVGLRLPVNVHYQHFENPQSVVPKSNMPAYGWLKENSLDASEVQSHMDALGLPYQQADLDALKGKNELDALVAYMLSLGHAVKKTAVVSAESVEMSMGARIYAKNCSGCHGENRQGGFGPKLAGTALSHAQIKERLMTGSPKGMPSFEGTLSGVEMDAVADFLSGEEPEAKAPSRGAQLFMTNCSGCHDEDGSGGYAPSLVDAKWLGKEGPIDDDRLMGILMDGTHRGMPPFEGTLTAKEADDIVEYMRSLAK